MFKALTIAGRLAAEDMRFRRRRITRRLIRKIAEIVLSDLDLTTALSHIGEAAAFEREHLMDVPYFKGRHELFAYALSKIPQDGLLMEFGVYKGDSLNRLARLMPERQWHGFDSFKGLPEAWTPGARAGAFDVQGRAPPVRQNVTLVHGFFADSLPRFAQQHRGECVAFMHIDCDLYSATQTIFEVMGEMLQPGCIIVFDEYFNYPDWKNGEYKALIEFTAKSGRTFDYLAYVRHDRQVAVRLR
jgi:Methyltransferase domain